MGRQQVYQIHYSWTHEWYDRCYEKFRPGKIEKRRRLSFDGALVRGWHEFAPKLALVFGVRLLSAMSACLLSTSWDTLRLFGIFSFHPEK